MQVTFEDVTAETTRHDRLEAYTGQVVLVRRRSVAISPRSSTTVRCRR